MMSKKTTVATLVAVLAVLGIGTAWSSFLGTGYAIAQHAGHDGHDDHAGHDDHDDDGHDDHAGHDDHDDHDGHDDHDAEAVVRLSDEDRDRFGVKVAAAGSGRLATRIRLPGELVLNADRVAHIVPRAPGIVREVLASVGDAVRSGDVLAWLESAELGEAKIDYLAKWAEVDGCTVDLTRAQTVHDNTAHLLKALNSTPSLETLRDMSGRAMGENGSVLISAYAELVLSEAAYQRERPLFEKKVSSERDYQAAKAKYEKADALYAATRDSVDFQIRRNLMEARRSQRVHQIELTGARGRLEVLGITPAEIAELPEHVNFKAAPATHEFECTDPNCTDCKQNAAVGGGDGGIDAHKSDGKLAWYPLRAPFDGTVIEKHLTLGEKHSDESGAFTVADLTSVWVNIAVYQKDLPHVRKGMDVHISTGSGMPQARGVIAYVAPIVDEKTRTALARVVLPNPDGQLRPGLFVSAEISIGQDRASIVIPKSAVQRMGEETVVFLETGEGFTPTDVVLGRSSDSRVEILSGLALGQRYVTHGAFELKAKIVTSGLDAHAGHGH